MDKPDEALQICNEIKQSNPDDERLLNDLHDIYNQLGKRTLISFIFLENHSAFFNFFDSSGSH